MGRIIASRPAPRPAVRPVQSPVRRPEITNIVWCPCQPEVGHCAGLAGQIRARWPIRLAHEGGYQRRRHDRPQKRAQLVVRATAYVCRWLHVAEAQPVTVSRFAGGSENGGLVGSREFH